MFIKHVKLLILGLVFNLPALANCPDVKVYCYSYEVDTAYPKAKTDFMFKTGSKWDWKTISCGLIQNKHDFIKRCQALNKNTHSVVYPQGHFKLIPDYTWTAIDIKSMPSERWMGALKDRYPKFSKAAIKDIIIPGTHDSASNHIRTSSAFSPDGIHISKQLSVIKSTELFNQIFANWSKTQPHDIHQQLNNGIRYFDIRLCANKGDIFSCHGKYSENFSSVIDQIKRFVSKEENKHELIILDLNHFYAMNGAAHEAVINHMVTAFGSAIAPRVDFNVNSPLEQFWNNDKQIIILYNNYSKVQSHPKLWSPSSIQSIWPNKQKVGNLLTVLNSGLEHQSKDQFYVIQSILTENEGIIVKSLYNLFAPNSIRTYAMDYKQTVYNWLHANQKRIYKKGGIIIEDWSAGKSLTHFAIDSNIKKFTN